MTPRSTQISKIANDLREKLGVATLEKFNILELLECRLVSAIPGFTLQIAVDSNMPCDTEAYADPIGPTIRVTQNTYDRARSGDARANFTLLHEVGHLALGHGGIRYRRAEDLAAKYDAAIKAEEREAMEFAAAFAAPFEMLRAGVTADEISKRFGLSAPAAAIRVREFEQHHRQLTGARRELPENVVDMIRFLKERGLPIKTPT